MNFTESVVEDAALAWLESVDYAINAILVVVRERSVSLIANLLRPTISADPLEKTGESYLSANPNEQSSDWRKVQRRANSRGTI
jgi:hypothetical protein